MEERRESTKRMRAAAGTVRALHYYLPPSPPSSSDSCSRARLRINLEPIIAVFVCVCVCRREQF